MSTRIDGGAQGALLAEDDDWFATVRPTPVELGDVPWDDESDWEQRDPVSPYLRRRQVALGVAVAVAVLLVCAGALIGRATKSSATKVVTVTTTATVETPAATGSEGSSVGNGTTTPSTSTDTSSSSTDTPSTPTSSSAVPTGATLRPADKGASVIALQTALTTLGYAPGAADGTYGAKTAAAVTAFQTAKGLTADGIAGAKTLTAINAELAGG
jgi:murein L,D-transpeptidase YcbB/YkuD